MHAVKISSSDFANRLRQDIVTNRIRLPSLPEVALRVRKAIDCECSAQEIADLVSQDIALSGRLVQIANSPLYRGAAKVDSIMVAVTRLGTRMVKNLVVGLAMRQMFRSSSQVLSKFFRDTCDDGIQVAGFCRALADELPGIDPDEAMLAGLLHNIGALPILARLDEAAPENIRADLMQALLDELAPTLGTQILQSWQLPDALCAIPEGCHDLQRDSGPGADYIDVVTSARLQYLVFEGLIDITPELAGVPALRKTGIQFETIVLGDEGQTNWAKQVSNALSA